MFENGYGNHNNDADENENENDIWDAYKYTYFKSHIVVIVYDRKTL